MEEKLKKNSTIECWFALPGDAEQISDLREKNREFLDNNDPIEIIEKDIKTKRIIVAREWNHIVWFWSVEPSNLMNHPRFNWLSKQDRIKGLIKKLHKDIKICCLLEACIEIEYRGRDIPKMLYQACMKEYGEKFDFIYGVIHKDNLASLHVHRDKLWFIPVNTPLEEKFINFVAPLKKNQELLATLQSK